MVTDCKLCAFYRTLMGISDVPPDPLKNTIGGVVSEGYPVNSTGNLWR